MIKIIIKDKKFASSVTELNFISVLKNYIKMVSILSN